MCLTWKTKLAYDQGMDNTTFAVLLDKALTEPGIISTSFRAFHNYSLGNQLLAYLQCAERGLPVGPIATFNGWKDKGRHVVKGQKALMLCMPVTIKGKKKHDDDEDVRFTKFIYPNKWFVLSQTDGQAYEPVALPEWTEATALKALDIQRVPFAITDGNTQGYASQRTVAISDLAEHPEKTLFHEIAHILLGHTTDEITLTDDAKTPRSLREVEAEGVAFLVGEALGLPGAAESRGYIQHWNARRDAEPIPEASARKIFKVATQILTAGRPAVEKTEAAS